MRLSSHNKERIKNAQIKKARFKRLIYVGNFSVSYTTEMHVEESFRANGWQVKEYQENTFKVDEVLKESEKGYDFLLFTRTWAETGEKYRQVLKHIKIPTVSYHLDLYIGLDREISFEQDSFWQSDYVFSADGGHQEKFREKGINHYWLSPGVYHNECYLGKKVREYEKDVIFVGSYRYHPEWRYREVLLNWLRNTYKDRFMLCPEDLGRGWIRGDDLNNLYASAKVVVGDSLYSPYYWSDRLPETLGRGGFLIFPKVPGIEDEGYRYYKHFVPYQYGDFKTLKEIVDYYVSHDEEREKIRLAGHKFVKENHTYKNKVAEIIKVLEKNNWRRNPIV